MTPNMLIIILFALSSCILTEGSHFYGGTIQYKPTGEPQQVQFDWTMGWRLTTGPCGPGCNESMIGQFTNYYASLWICSSGCPVVTYLAPVQYTLTAISTSANWEMGKHWFNYTFPADGAYNVSYTGNAWRRLNYGTSGPWALITSVIIGERSDTGLINHSPSSSNFPIYNIQHGCSPSSATAIELPLLDADGDTITCRWARGAECASVCNSLPDAVLINSGSHCQLVLDTTTNNYVASGWYAVAITVEDFPKTNIIIGNTTFYTPNDPISFVPVQFIIYVPAIPTMPCNYTPEWVDPTPPEGTVFDVLAGMEMSFNIHAFLIADSTLSISSIEVNGPPNLVRNPLAGLSPDDQGRAGTVMLSLTWQTAVEDIGKRSLCFQASDNFGKQSSFRCVVIHVMGNVTATATQAPATRNPKELVNIRAGKISGAAASSGTFVLAKSQSWPQSASTTTASVTEIQNIASS